MAVRSLASGWKIARIFDITIRVHVTWLIIVALLTYSLAVALLPLSNLAEGRWWGKGLELERRIQDYSRSHPGVPEAAVYERFGVEPWPQWHYWVLGLIGALGLFVCVLAHELSHSLVARAEGIPVEGITLFIFGGMARIGGEARTPDSEFKVAAAGPLMSLAIGLSCGLLYWMVGSFLAPQARALLFYFMFVNVLLMVFNLVPGFPLDGGRLLRAILWKILDNFRRATFVASICGRVVAGGMILVALLVALGNGDLLGGAWLGIIGLFLWHAAKASYRQVELREALAGLTARDAVRPEPVTVAPDLTLDELVQAYFWRHRQHNFPVTDAGGRALGRVGLSEVRSVPRAEWTTRPVRDVMRRINRTETVSLDEDMWSVFQKTMQVDGAALPVVDDDGRLTGVVTQADVMNLLRIRTELTAGGR